MNKKRLFFLSVNSATLRPQIRFSEKPPEMEEREDADEMQIEIDQPENWNDDDFQGLEGALLINVGLECPSRRAKGTAPTRWRDRNDRRFLLLWGYSWLSEFLDDGFEFPALQNVDDQNNQQELKMAIREVDEVNEIEPTVFEIFQRCQADIRY